MKKQFLTFAILLPILILSFSFVSASWFSDFFGKSTGKVTFDQTCISDGQLDDILGETSCCSGTAVGGSTLCANPSDWFTTWESCTQICGTGPTCPYGPTGTQWCPCPAGTANNGDYGIGACLTIETNQTSEFCTDSDGGNNIYVKGTLTDKNNYQTNGSILTHEDFCLANKAGYLVEFYCSGVYQDSNLTFCPYGCSDGACMQPGTSGLTYPLPFVFGGSADVAVVYGTGSGVSALDIVEAGIIKSSLESSVIGTSEVSLIKDEEVGSTYGKNLIVVGSAYPRITNSIIYQTVGGTSSLREGQFLIASHASPYKSGKIMLVIMGYNPADTANAVTYLRTNQVETSVGKSYIGTSSTNATTNQTNEFCTDSDGGNNIYVKGTLTDKNNYQTNGSILTHEDFCSTTSTGEYITEFYCSGVYQDSSFISCPNGCVDGACVGESGTNQTTNQTNSTSEGSCSGCYVGSECYPFGYRTNSQFCSGSSSTFNTQFQEGAVCNNNFECDSNACVSGQCISQSLLQKFLDWINGIFG